MKQAVPLIVLVIFLLYSHTSYSNDISSLNIMEASTQKKLINRPVINIIMDNIYLRRWFGHKDKNISNLENLNRFVEETKLWNDKYNKYIDERYINEIATREELYKIIEDANEKFTNFIQRMEYTPLVMASLPIEEMKINIKKRCKTEWRNKKNYDLYLICSNQEELEKKLAKKLNYKLVSSKVNNDLVKKEYKYINKIYGISKNIHKTFQNYYYNEKLSIKWNNILNSVISSSSNFNIYKLVIEYKEDILLLNELLYDDRVVLKRYGSKYIVEIKSEKRLEKRINFMFTKPEGKALLPAIVDLKQYSLLYSIAIFLDKNKVIEVAKYRGEAYTSKKKKAYISSNKVEPPKTIGSFGNLYLSSIHLDEFNKYGILDVVMYHEAVHVKYKLLRLENIYINNKFKIYLEDQILDTKKYFSDYSTTLPRSLINKEMNDNDERIARSAEYQDIVMGSNKKSFHEELLELLKAYPVDKELGIPINEMLKSRKFFTFLLEVFVDDEVMNYVSPRDFKKYFRIMKSTVSFNNRYKLLDGHKYRDRLQKYSTDKVYVNHIDFINDYVLHSNDVRGLYPISQFY